MTYFDAFLLALALAMDCFTVSITCGILQRRMGAQVWLMAFLFGLFQAVMPWIGWQLTGLFEQQISNFDHWIAFSLLMFLGLKMCWDARNPEEKQHYNPSHLGVLFMLAVATSIDALSVGVSFWGMGLKKMEMLLMPLLQIGVVSFVLSVIGKYIGVKVGRCVNFRAGYLGGVLLIFIGCKVLAEHLCT
ncbi:MAG: manganese efflux pump [Bacteroidaceae bacterium]|nr:manganese efflux pump [Bacteroidaceae bacterium]